jgi:hypothetical protein
MLWELPDMAKTFASATLHDTMASPSKVVKESGSDCLMSYILAGVGVGAVAVFFFLTGAGFYHWFVLPAMACGVLAGADMVRWLRGFLDSFDPKGLIGIVIFYGFFIAPLLHVYWNFYTVDLTGDPRYWLGVTAAINVLGLVFYKICQRWSYKHTAPVLTRWRLIQARLLPILTVATLVGVSAEFYYNFVVLRQIARVANPNLDLQLTMGYGWLLMLGDPLLILFLTAFISWTVTPERNRNLLVTALVLSLALLSQLVWVGLRGSRSATVVGVFWCVGLIHHYWRRVRPVHLLLGLFCLVTFMYFYGFYKSGGWQAVRALEAGMGVNRLERQTGRNLYSVLLGDLARADIQARIANGVTDGINNYQLRYGLTYLAALSKLIPQTLWLVVVGDLSFKDDWGKGKAFVDLDEGKGKFDPLYHPCSRVFGLSGEAMLNFGLPGVPLAWLVFGLWVGWLRRKSMTMATDDTRWPLALFFAYVAVLATVSDLDLLVYAIFNCGFLIFVCIFLWSGKGEFKESD